MIAAGLWSPAVARMAGVTLPIIVGRHPVFVVERDAGFGPPHVVYLDLAGGAYVRPETGGLTLTGSLTDDETQHPMDPEALGGDVGGDEAALTLERTARSVPRLAEGTFRRGWAGAFDITPDWMPILDRAPVDGLLGGRRHERPRLQAVTGRRRDDGGVDDGRRAAGERRAVPSRPVRHRVGGRHVRRLVSVVTSAGPAR